MKIKFNVVLLSLLFSMTVFAVSYSDCVPSEDQEGLFTNDIQNATNYQLILGFGDSDPLTPDEIEVMYSDSGCTTIVKYHAHNGDTAQGDSSLDERNILYGTGTSSSTMLTVKNRISSTRTNSHWIMYGAAILTTNNYQITLNESATSGDPFNGIESNAASFIHARVNFGSDDSPCVSKSLRESSDSEDSVITFSGQDGTACEFTIIAPDSNIYTAEMNVISANVTVSNGLVTPALSADLMNQGGKKVGTMEFNYQTIVFKDNDGSSF